MCKIIVHCYTTDETINKISISYMINPTIIFKNVLRTQVKKCLSVSFYASTMKNMKYFLMKKNTCVMAPIMFYENIGEIKIYRVLICVVYSLIYNYACIDYL